MRIGILCALLFVACGSSDVPDGGAPWNGLPQDGGTDDDASASTMPPPGGPEPPSLGATPEPGGGVTFRVWAPYADAVGVSGDWNHFDAVGDPLTSDGSGHFSGTVAAAAVGMKYQFLVSHAGTVLARQDPRARQVVVHTGPALIVDPRAYAWSSSFTAPPVEDQVVYELHLGTFNPPTGTVAGTFATAEQKLDYLAALGINMIEVMPPVEWPSVTSWGYSADFPFAIQHSYGTPDDARHFVDAAHAHGIGVIIDIVHNHYSGRDQPLTCWDGECPSTMTRGVWFYADATKGTTPWGPRPDYSRPEVRSYIKDNAFMWLDEYRCDGLRWDSVSNIRGLNNGATDNPDGRTLLESIMAAVHAQFPRALMIAEDLQTLDFVTGQPHLGFDTQWDAAFFHPIDDTVIAATDASRSMPSIASAVSHVYNGKAFQRVVYSEDHDEVANGRSRIPEMISPGNAGSLDARKRSTLAAAIVMTSPGIPMIFMGQEFLENGHFSDTNPLDWSKTQTYAGILQLYTDLIRLRHNADGTTAGLKGEQVKVFQVNDSAKVIAYQRDNVTVIANFSKKAFTSYRIGLPSAGAWHVRFNSDDTRYSADFGGTPQGDVSADGAAQDGFGQSGVVALAPYGVLILSQ
jgi:1,4-alpha-glucan branching enzyme